MSKSLDLFRNPWRDPFKELTAFQNSFRNFFDDFGALKGAPSLARKEDFFHPTCEVEETDTQYLFKFDMPGVNKDQIKIDLKDNFLTVSAERREEKKDSSNNRHYSEISYGSYERAFTLPTTVNAEKVEAKYENGVLKLVINKETPAKARQITVK